MDRLGRLESHPPTTPSPRGRGRIGATHTLLQGSHNRSWYLYFGPFYRVTLRPSPPVKKQPPCVLCPEKMDSPIHRSRWIQLNWSSTNIRHLSDSIPSNCRLTVSKTPGIRRNCRKAVFITPAKISTWQKTTKLLSSIGLASRTKGAAARIQQCLFFIPFRT